MCIHLRGYQNLFSFTEDGQCDAGAYIWAAKQRDAFSSSILVKSQAAWHLQYDQPSPHS